MVLGAVSGRQPGILLTKRRSDAGSIEGAGPGVGWGGVGGGVEIK